jgi:hypothetical protein
MFWDSEIVKWIIWILKKSHNDKTENVAGSVWLRLLMGGTWKCIRVIQWRAAYTLPPPHPIKPIKWKQVSKMIK